MKKKDKKKEILDKIAEISGENVFVCYQCGRCTSGCMFTELMDYMPNQLIRLLQLGEIDDVNKSKTIWLCASCFSCTARCPKGVDLAKILEAVRQIILRKTNQDHCKLNELDEDDICILPQIALVANFRKQTS